jgi:YHS domain-containing protein
MLLRLILFVVLAVFVARAFWRLVDGIVAGVAGRPLGGAGGVPQRVQMVRDPVCGTFLLPERAVMLSDGRTRLFFCSDACRDKYRLRPSTDPGRPDSTDTGSPRAASTGKPVEGRRV